MPSREATHLSERNKLVQTVGKDGRTSACTLHNVHVQHHNAWNPMHLRGGQSRKQDEAAHTNVEGPVVPARVCARSTATNTLSGVENDPAMRCASVFTSLAPSEHEQIFS